MSSVDIHPLTPGRVGDYFHFFDEVAFADHPEWSWCYCTFYHMDRAMEQSDDIQGKEDLRNLARRLIEDGTMAGYLAYENGEVVAWCNAGNRTTFKRLAETEGIWQSERPERIKSVVCFIVAHTHRRQGLAKALLARVTADAQSEGYDAVEAYPATGDLDCYGHFHGHEAMYAACGFSKEQTLDGFAVMRYTLPR